MAKSNQKTIVISILDYFGKESLPISILKTKILIFSTKKVNIAMIDIDAYWISYKLKRARVFIISMRNLEYQIEKEARPETDPKTIVPEEYHNLLDVFSKKN